MSSSPFSRQWRWNGSNANATSRPLGSTITCRSRSTSAKAPPPIASISGRSSSGGSTIVTRPILKQFVAKMSPYDGAITTSKP